MHKNILEKDMLHENLNGSVYFDVEKFKHKPNEYGKLKAGGKLEDMIAIRVELAAQDEKKKSSTKILALWKKAEV